MNRLYEAAVAAQGVVVALAPLLRDYVPYGGERYRHHTVVNYQPYLPPERDHDDTHDASQPDS